MANELIGLAAYIGQRLASDPALTALVSARIYADEAPQIEPDTLPGGPDYDPGYPAGRAPESPYIVFYVVHSKDSNSSANRGLVSALVTVEAIGEGGAYEDLAPVDKRFDSLLQNPPPAQVVLDGTTYQILGGYRESPLMRPEIKNGVRYNYLGGDYRYFLSPA